MNNYTNSWVIVDLFPFNFMFLFLQQNTTICLKIRNIWNSQIFVQKLFDFKNLLKISQLIFYLRTLSSRDDKTYWFLLINAKLWLHAIQITTMRDV